LIGDLNSNKAPETHTIIDTIIRSGSSRFQSIVKINWWGDDPDGYVAYYEYSFDKVINSNTVWHKVIGLDSTFILVTPAGTDTADFAFNIRAVDNKGLADPTPARVGYPIKNTAPTVIFTPGIYNPTYTFPVVRLYWQATDLDGADNLDHLELIWNDTTLRPTKIDASISSGIFEATNLSNNTTTTRIYANNNIVAMDSVVRNFKLQNSNQLYIRAVDKSNTKSNWVASYSIYIRKPTSTILLIDAYTTPSSSAMNFYGQRMTNNGHPTFDTIRLFEKIGGQFSQLAADNATQSKIFKLFNGIIWFGDNTNNSLFLAQKTTNDFFSNGGKMFMANKLESLFDENSPLLSLTPAQSLYNNNDTTLLLQVDSLANSTKAGFPILKSTVYIPIIKPLQLLPGAINLYSSHLSVKDNINNPPPPYPLWMGNSSIIAEKSNSNNQPVMIYSEVELQSLNGNNNIDLMWAKILTELGL